MLFATTSSDVNAIQALALIPFGTFACAIAALVGCAVAGVTRGTSEKAILELTR